MKQFHVSWCRTSLVVLSVLLGIGTAGVAQAQQRARNSGQRMDAARGPARQQQQREQPALRQAANPRASAEAQSRAPVSRVPEVQMPRWLPLSPDHQNYITQLLRAWEAKSAAVDRYQCEFTRWKYDLGFGPNGDLVRDADGREAASEIVKGVIKFEAPDKALFQVMETSEYSLLNPTAKKKIIGPWRFDVSKGEYREVPLEEVGEHWVCDGQFFYEFAYHQKMLRKIPLPEESKGDAIARGPLPFLFRAKADDINNRFWLRIVTPQGEKEAYHLEATPKSIEDSSQFGRVIIILDRKEFLPKAMIIYPIGSRADDDLLPGQPPQPPIREVFVFDDRKVNSKLEDLYFWKRSFHEPAVPKGWKLSQEPPFGAQNVVEQPQPSVDAGISPAAAIEAARNARRPR